MNFNIKIINGNINIHNKHMIPQVIDASEKKINSYFENKRVIYNSFILLLLVPFYASFDLFNIYFWIIGSSFFVVLIHMFKFFIFDYDSHFLTYTVLFKKNIEDMISSFMIVYSLFASCYSMVILFNGIEHSLFDINFAVHLYLFIASVSLFFYSVEESAKYDHAFECLLMLSPNDNGRCNAENFLMEKLNNKAYNGETININACWLFK